MSEQARRYRNTIALVGVAGLAAVAVFLARRHRDAGKDRPAPAPPPVEVAKDPKTTPGPALARGARSESGESILAALEAEAAATSIPVWGAELTPLEPGAHRYWFYRDGKQIADPANPVTGDSRVESLFRWPPRQPANSTATLPRVLDSDRAMFLYRGPIERSLLFIAPFRGEWWGTDEFRPLNAAARENLERVRADRSLATVEGIVITSDRLPVSGARVRLQSAFIPNTAAPQHIQTVACNEQGRFRIERVRSARVTASARAAGFAENGTVPFDAPSTAVEIVLSPTSLMTGIVRNESGRPVGQARVTAWTEPEDYRNAPREESDALGRFAFGNLKPATYYIAADAEGYVPARKGGIVVSSDGQGRHVELVVTKGLSVRGRAIQRTKDGGEGPGLEGAEVRTTIWFPRSEQLEAPESPRSRGSSFDRTIRSGAGGGFVIDGLVWKANVRVNAQYQRMSAEKEERFVLDEGKPLPEVKIYFPLSGKLAGRVVDTEKQPVPGATVRLLRVGSPQTAQYSGVPQRSTSFNREGGIEFVADGAGRFVIDGVETNCYCAVMVTAAGYSPTYASNLLVDSPVEAEIVLKRGASLEGRVVEAGSGQPLAGMTVNVDSSNRMTTVFLGVGRDLKTGEDGSFRLNDLDAGLYRLGARGKVGNTSYVSNRDIDVWIGEVQYPRSPEYIHVGEGQAVKDVVIRVEPTATVKGVVKTRRSQKPVEGAAVYASVLPDEPGMPRQPVETKTDADGTFVLEEVTPGNIRVAASKKAYAGAEKKVEVKGGQTLEEVELLLGEPGTVTGVVLDESDRPAPDVPVKLVTHYTIASSKTGADGRFAIENIGLPQPQSSSRPLRVAADLKGEDRRYGESDKFKLTEEEPTAEVTVRLKPGGTITGTVCDESSRPVEAASAYARLASDSSGESLYGRTDASGRYEILRLPPGEYKVSSYKQGYKQRGPDVAGVKVEIGRETGGIDLVLENEKKKEKEEEKVTFKGILLDARAKPLAGWSVSARPQDSGPAAGEPAARAGTAHDGSFVLAGLRPGKYRLGFPGSEYQGSGHLYLPSPCFAAQGVDVKKEQKDAVPFVVPTGATMKGRFLVEGSRQPVPSARITVRMNDLKDDPRWQTYRNNQYEERPIPANVPDGQVWLTFFKNDYQVTRRDEGRVKIDGLPIDTLAVSIQTTMTLPHEIKNLVPNKNFEIDLGEVVLPAGKRVKMQLIDGRTGQPLKPTRREMPGGYALEGINVGLMLARPSQGMPYTWDGRGCVPDANGVILITPVDDALTTIAISTPDFLPLKVGPVRLSAETETDLGTFTLDPGRTITGRVIEAATGRPLSESSGKHLWVEGKNAAGRYVEPLYPGSGSNRIEVSDDGRFTIRRVPPDLYSLYFDCVGESANYVPRVIAPVVPAPTGDTDLGDVALERGYTLRGRLLGPNGETVHSGSVNVRAFVMSREGGREVRREFSRNDNADADGEFELRGLPAGELKLKAECYKQSGNDWLGTKYSGRIETTVTLDPNSKTPVEIRFPANAGQ